MSTVPPSPPSVFLPPMAAALRDDLRSLKANWYWFVILGIILIVLGSIAISVPHVFTNAAIFTFGVLMLVGGFVSILGSFYTGSWGGFFLTLLHGALMLVIGFLTVNHVDKFDILYTMLLAAFFMVGGLFRILAGLFGQFYGKFWVLLNGVITLALGVMIWRSLPCAADWVIGLFLGIDMIFAGWSEVFIGLKAKHLPVSE